MKKTLLLFAGIFSLFCGISQKNETIHAQTIPVVFHGITQKLSDFVEPKNAVNEITKQEKIGYHQKKDWGLNPSVNPNALPKGEDPAWQKENPSPNLNKALTLSWDGIGYSNVNPADPTVDVGPNHVVQMINGPSGAYIQVFNKTGTALTTPVYFDNFMSMPGGAGDPIVLYDERADRWLLSEFSSSGNNMHVAISTTSDPTGTYYTYSFNAPAFPDYPKYSIWENEYIITANVNTADIYALNRTNLLAGIATPAQSFLMSNFGTIGFQAATPVSLNGTVVPPSGSPAMVMRMRDDAWTGAATDALEIWEVDIDWITPANSSLSQVQTLGTSPIDTELCGYTAFSCIDQPGGGTPNLDPLREVLMNRIHYRNFGTHEAIVACHVTDVNGADRAGIRWYELRRTGGASGSWTIYQEGTYSPDTDSRWMPSIGISASGNIGLAYNVSSSTTFPSLRYTGRKVCDPLNSMTEPETTIAAGSAANASNRYGDYNAMGLDPTDGETFFFTGMYNTTSQWSTRIGAFNIPTCGATIAFNANTYTVEEANASVPNGCLNYLDISVPISIGQAPTANADVTVSVAGGTASPGSDFDILNTNHTLNSSNLSGTVTIRVYNDQYVEGPETILLDYTLNANGGNAAQGTINQTVTITINDDDLAPNASFVTSTILSEDFESPGLGSFTTLNPSGNTAWQSGTNATVPNGAYSIPASNTTSFAWIDDDDCNCNQNNVDLISPSMDLSNYTTATLTFDSYFEDNTYTNINENADVYVTVGGGPEILVGPLVASQIDVSWTAQSFDLTPYVGNSNVVIKIKYSDGTGWLYGCAVDNILVTGTSPIAIQTAVNSGVGQSAYLGPNETVHFYDPASGNVMLSLENTSGFDYGCVTVEVDRQGTTPTALQFNSANPADFLHSKTYTITPTNSNPTGTYNVTLYYEEAEVATWETLTSNSRNNAEIIKVGGPNQINDVTPANATTFSISNAVATLGAFGSDVTFTASFSTGFSGFGVGIYNPNTGMLPSASFSASSNAICVGSAITFSDQSSGSPTSWNWNFGDGNASTSQNPTHTYSTPGLYPVTLIATNSSGSDTITIAGYITVHPTFAVTQNSALCPGESVTVGSNTYTASGTYTDVLSSVNGCDSTITTNVSMLSATNATQNIQICQGSSYSIGSNTYTSSGTYTDILVNAAGCDSIVTTNLSVVSNINQSLSYALCPGESVTVGTSTYSSPGVYTDVLPSNGGCDSTITTTITALQTSTSNQTVEICQGSSYSVGSSTYTSTGIYTDVLTNVSGCDSTVTTDLTVHPLPAVSITPGSVDPLCSDEPALSLIGSPIGGTFSGTGVVGNTFDPSISGTGTFVITYNYIDNNNCSNSTGISITVEDCAGIAQESLEGVKVSPNPNNGKFSITGLEIGTNYQVFDDRGRLIYEGTTNTLVEEVHVDVASNGIYYLKAVKSGKEGILKFLIAH